MVRKSTVGLCYTDAVYISRYRKEEQRQTWTFVDLRGGELLIKTPPRNQSLQRTGNNSVRMQLCNPFNDDQRLEGDDFGTHFTIFKHG